MKMYENFRSAHILVLMLVIMPVMLGCGSDQQGNIEGEDDNLNTDLQAFSKALHPVLVEHCADCHNGSVSGIQLVNFANTDPAIAHAYIINRDLINRDTPNNSIIVDRILNDKHICWTSCANDAVTVTNAIKSWNFLLANDNGGPVIGVDPQASIEAFSQSVYPVVTQYCAGCHDGSTVYAAFAVPNVETAHDITKNRALADLNSPNASPLVIYLSAKEHFCWSDDCASDAQQMVASILEWQQLLTAGPVIGNNNAPIAIDDSYVTSAGVAVFTDNVLINDLDADNDTLIISESDTNSLQGGVVVNNFDGTFYYVPPELFTGTDSFNYTIVDGNGGSDTAKVSIVISEVDNGVEPLTSVEAFSQSVYPIVTQYCAGCHDGSTNYTAFAAQNVETAHELTLNNALVDFNSPDDSPLVSYLSVREHFCWSNCDTDALQMETAILGWQQLLSATQ